MNEFGVVLNQADKLMKPDEATIEKFVRRVIESETVFLLSNKDGVAHSVADDDELTGIQLFWSNEANAARATIALMGLYSISETALFDFLYKRLPRMSDDGVLAGLDWLLDETDDGEIGPLELRELVENKMPIELVEKYKAKYN